MNSIHISQSNESESFCNIAVRLENTARILGEKPAIIQAVNRDSHGKFIYERFSFSELNSRIDQTCFKLMESGIEQGMRIILMVPPGIDFFVLTFALFKLGAVPVFIDPGMPKDSLLKCLAEVEAEGFISITKGHLLRRLFRKQFPTLQILICVDKSFLPARWFGAISLNDLAISKQPFPHAIKTSSDTAAVLFTSGSTGIPKGTVYTHGMFNSQVDILMSVFHYGYDEVDVPTFPLFALFDVVLGMTAVIPKMDFTKPGFVHPPDILDIIRDFSATHMFGSPALLDRVGSWAKLHNIEMTSIKRVITAGAPVRPDIINTMKSVLPKESDLYTAYGATESLPVAFATGSMILSETAQEYYSGKGTCVGYPVDQVSVRIIKITDAAVSVLADVDYCANYEVGEIMVQGPVVTQEYFRRQEETWKSKVWDDEKGIFWHRMGDCGYLDDSGRLWFCGRKSQRVRCQDNILFTEFVEGVVNGISGVFRSALVGIGPEDREIPVIWLELRKNANHNRVREDVATAVRELNLNVSPDRILIKKQFPVDIRHNAKIFREKLKAEACSLLSEKVH